MISGRDVVVIAGIDWGYLWQSTQEICHRLVRAGNRVLYIENTGVRAPALRDAGRIGSRIASWLRGLPAGGVRPTPEGVFVSSPLVFPPSGRRWTAVANRRLLIPLIRMQVRRHGFRNPLVWTFLPTETACAITRELRPSLVIYHCTADFPLLAADPQGIAASERNLLRSCDLVFATCEELERHCAQQNARVHRFPNGVDLDSFPLAPGQPAPGGGPAVIGYIGGLHRFVDLGLLDALVRARPGWRWTFVGHCEAEARSLAAQPNVRMAGPRPHSDLAGWLRSFDVCIIPYRTGSGTSTIFPSKLNEYLAAGKPVVSTPLATVQEYHREHGVLRIAPNNPEEFLAAIEQALSCRGEDGEAVRRRAAAACFDWGILLERMSGLIEQRLLEKRAGGAKP